MGSLATYTGNDCVLPELLAFSDDHDRVLLVHGVEEGKDFWWPPGSYWMAEKACDLAREQPEDWIARVMRAQIGVAPNCVRLRGVELIGQGHPPVMLYEVQLKGEPVPSPSYSFDKASYFPVADLPRNLGRDDRHGQWLRDLLTRTT